MMASSIEIPIRRNDSMSVDAGDFVVLGESPVVQLSEDIDVLQQLSVEFGNQNSVASTDLKVDIERLTAENRRLSKAIAETNQSQKVHIERFTAWKEQMTKTHERDVTMLEEARLATLAIKKERDELEKSLKATKAEYDAIIVEKYRLEKEHKTIVDELEAKLRDTEAELQDVGSRAQEASFVKVENDNSIDEKTLERFLTEIEELKKQVEASQTAEANPVIAELTAEVEALKKKLEEQKEQHESTMADAEKSHEAKIGDLQARLNQLEVEAGDLKRQMSADRASWDVEREERIKALTMKVQDMERELGMAKGLESMMFKVKAERDEISEKYLQKQLEFDSLTERHRVLQADKERVQTILEASQFQLAELDELRQKLASSELLQRDQEFQIEAIRDALRNEQEAKQKCQQSYESLLLTWQKFESDQPVVVNGSPSMTSSLDSAALTLANAEKARLDEEVRSLKETIRELDSQNRLLLEQVNRVTPQLTSSAMARQQAPLPDMSCPLCSLVFTDQRELAQHASSCSTNSIF